MERFYREQPKNEDVRFVTIPEQKGEAAEWRGFTGGEGEIDNLPVDTMEGLQVSKVIPAGFYAEPAVVETPADDNDEPTDEPTVEPDENGGLPEEE